ncbi:MAG TPA: type II/IV secretion system ATPase subunit [Methanomassiliicoccales archaeon]|nr:type II/IV secretion system ATPase subunit [Methanomassiliicoccales archaeon]
MDDLLRAEADKNPHLKKYLRDLSRTTTHLPKFYEKMSIKELNEIRTAAVKDPAAANVIYRVGSGYVHIDAPHNRYISIEMSLTEKEKEKMKRVRDLILEKASEEKSIDGEQELVEMLHKLFDKSVIKTDSSGFAARLRAMGKVTLSPQEYRALRYFIRRDIAGYGPIEPLILDPYIEDIHSVGTDLVHVAHKAFQYALETNVQFPDDETLNDYLISLSERIGRPVSAARPIIDGTLPDGSRINVIYSDDISKKGSSFTIRKFSAEPISAVQLYKFGTFSPELVAYLWLCLEHKMNMMVAGETASGKTTTLNAIIPFIDHRAKIYSAEDTPEVKPPHSSWQRCVTRESGPEESRVTMFDLLRAALRSRPDYIVIGEIRGEEGRVAYQAMQTGIPVMATFHAASATKFIQRFTGDPIRVPMTFIDNLNVLLLQSAVNVNGRFLRRVTAVEEFIGFSAETNGVLTRNVFKWDPRTDKMLFRGMNNSYILEEKVALLHGFSNKKDIYGELNRRAKIVTRAAEEGVLGYQQVNEMLRGFTEKKEEGLPFAV